MSVIRSERNESDCLYLYNGLQLYKYTLERYKKLPKEYNGDIKPRIEECADKILFNLMFAYRYQVSNLHEYQTRKDILRETNAWLEKLDCMISIAKEKGHVEKRIAIPWEELIDNEFRLIRKERDKDKLIAKELAR